MADFNRYKCIGSYVFKPYAPGKGPVFVLTMWDTFRRDEYRKNILAYRLAYATTSRDARVVFEGEDYSCPPSTAIDSNECVACIMGFLTSRGDYVYTDVQEGFFANYAEALACESVCLYGEG